MLPTPNGTGKASGTHCGSGTRLAFTTDSFVVNPLFFPGGDIGELAVDGTVNDLAMAGAVPEWLSAGFIIEEGFPLESLRRIVTSMAAAARTAGVRIVTGDTKVVDRGKADGVFINTAGIGCVPDGVEISPERVEPGDVILLSGDIGRHGMAVMSVREGLRFETTLESDCAPLGGLVEAMLAAGGSGIHCLRDLTRGGLAATLNEIAQDVRVGVEIDEPAVPGNRAGRVGLRTAGIGPILCGQRRSAGSVCLGRGGRAGVGGDESPSGGDRSGADRHGNFHTSRHGRASRLVWAGADTRPALGRTDAEDLLTGDCPNFRGEIDAAQAKWFSRRENGTVPLGWREGGSVEIPGISCETAGGLDNTIETMAGYGYFRGAGIF